MGSARRRIVAAVAVAAPRARRRVPSGGEGEPRDVRVSTRRLHRVVGGIVGVERAREIGLARGLRGPRRVTLEAQLPVAPRRGERVRGRDELVARRRAGPTVEHRDPAHAQQQAGGGIRPRLERGLGARHVRVVTVHALGVAPVGGRDAEIGGQRLGRAGVPVGVVLAGMAVGLELVVADVARGRAPVVTGEALALLAHQPEEGDNAEGVPPAVRIVAVEALPGRARLDAGGRYGTGPDHLGARAVVGTVVEPGAAVAAALPGGGVTAQAQRVVVGAGQGVRLGHRAFGVHRVTALAIARVRTLREHARDRERSPGREPIGCGRDQRPGREEAAREQGECRDRGQTAELRRATHRAGLPPGL